MPCDQSSGVSASGQRVARRRRFRSTSWSSGMSMRNGRTSLMARRSARKPALRAETFDERGVVRGLLLASEPVVRKRDPRLRAPRPDVPDRLDPARVVEGSAAHTEEAGRGNLPVGDATAAIPTEPTVATVPGIRRPLEDARLAAGEREARLQDRRWSGERSAPNGLTIGAMTVV